ncbi:uncharacterized protein LOC134272299 [Saccostrea cucullata]|uniref:uncharacterized protein LOC134272299 n=1 Tax=Saccostrea cuccullata TaxID=36930 RepID=UPI002ED44FEC
MSSNEHEPLKKKSRIGKAKDPTEVNNPSLKLETEAITSPDSSRRKKHTSSSSSTNSSSCSLSEPGEDVESSVFNSPTSSESERNYPANCWCYKDLAYLNIYYEKEPETLDKFVKDVKEAFVKEKGFCPDISKISDILKKEVEEVLTFSYDLTEIKNVRKLDHKEKTAKKVKQEMKEIADKANSREMPVISDEKAFGPALEKFVQKSVVMMNSAIIDFAKETSCLIRRLLFGVSSGGKEAREGKSQDGTGFRHYCELFGRIFFLLKGPIPERIFRFHGKKVRSTPDLVYHFDSGMSSEELLLVVEAKQAPLRENVTDIEELVGKSVLGQFGAELLGQSQNSVFFPNALGVLCIRTKLIFAFLKISRKHSDGIHNGDRGTAEDPGKITFTEPFDVLKAEDRLKLAEFMLWLGIAQDSVKFQLF